MKEENSIDSQAKENGQSGYSLRNPRICYICLPDYCFMRCKMCTIWKNKITPPPISLKQWETFFTSLKSFLGGTILMSIAGGEPLIHRDVCSLIRMMDDFGFDRYLTSNGYLINRFLAGKIVESGLPNIGLSLDSLNSQTHDYLRGKPNSFLRVTDAIRYLRELSDTMHIGIMTVISEKNKDEILSLVEWVQSNRDLNYISFQAIMQPFGEAVDQNWYLKEAYKELWPQDKDKICGILDSLINLKKNGSWKIGNKVLQLETFKKYFRDPETITTRARICNSIDYGISVDYYGKIYLCLFHDPIGDIFHDFREVYYSDKARKVREKIMGCKKNCHFLVNCNFEG